MTIVSLTFDDGYLMHYEVARRLYRMDVQATFFIISGLKEYAGEKLLTLRPDFIKEILEMGHEIGSHTHRHKDLTRIEAPEIEEELVSSLNFLRKFAEEPIGLAYPYGSFNENAMKIASKYYIYARTMGPYNKWNSIRNMFCIGGMGVRHFPEIVLRSLFSRKSKLAVLVFHKDVEVAIITAKILRDLGFEVKPLKEAVKIL
jgi:peptidoglycan/xylan/chitin deacetylase (PgdA/CDA1 family)